MSKMAELHMEIYEALVSGYNPRLIASVLRERIQQISSACLPRFGSRSELSHIPHWPNWEKLYFDGAMGKRAWPLVIVVRRWPLRMLAGRSLSYISFIFGL